MQNKKIFLKNKIEMQYNFARQIRQMRENIELLVRQLADEHVPEQYIRRLELGYIQDWGLIFAIAQFFDKKIKIEFY